jgi:thiol-disulfide isomerase/thioredoxin
MNIRTPNSAGNNSLRAALLGVLVAGGCALSLPAWSLEPGNVAPAFELPTKDKPIKLEHFVGKVVYLDFWASWCGPCKQSFPWMNEMQSKYGPQGFQVIGVGLDARHDDALRFLNSTSANFTVAFDHTGDTPQRFSVKGMPTSVLIGRDGRVLSTHVGFSAQTRESLERAIVLALETTK